MERVTAASRPPSPGLTRPSAPGELLRPGLLVAGVWRSSGSGGTREHIDPTTGQVQQAFALAGPTEVDEAVAGARAALRGWRSWSVVRRQGVLNELGRLIRAHADELAAINALEVGTPAALSASRYRAGPGFFEYYAGWLDKANGDTFRSSGARST